MSGYADFARFYDMLTENVDYSGMASRLHALIGEFGKSGGNRLLDAACGTGTLCAKLAEYGYSVIGADASEEMLTAAYTKCCGQNVRLIRQDLTGILLDKPADAVVCTLDSINHLQGAEEVRKAFLCIYENLAPGGVFLFDVNTCYKHEKVLGGRDFVLETDGLLCAWRNDFCAETCSVEIALDFFEEQPDGSYLRYSEDFTEYAYPPEEIIQMLADCGFTEITQYEDYSDQPPKMDAERILFAACKPVKE